MKLEVGNGRGCTPLTLYLELRGSTKGKRGREGMEEEDNAPLLKY